MGRKDSASQHFDNVVAKKSSSSKQSNIATPDTNTSSTDSGMDDIITALDAYMTTINNLVANLDSNVKLCPYHQAILGYMTKEAGVSGSSMQRWLNEGSHEAPTIVYVKADGKLSINKPCECAEVMHQ